MGSEDQQGYQQQQERQQQQESQQQQGRKQHLGLHNNGKAARVRTLETETVWNCKYYLLFPT